MERHRKRISKPSGLGFTVLAMLAVLAAACGAGDPTMVDSLDGSRWEMTSVREGDDLVAANVTTIATAVFAEGTVVGSDGCNRYRASYSTDGNSISIGDPTLTGFACDPEYTAQGTAFLSALQASDRFNLSDEALELVGEDGAQLRFRPAQDLPLIGVSWLLSGYAGSEGGMVSPLSDTEISLNFLPDGTLSGIAGCNSYHAGYQITGNELTIGDLTRTVIGCVEPDGVMTQEGDYLTALLDVEVFSTTLTGLELLNAAGNPGAEYRFGGRIR